MVTIALLFTTLEPSLVTCSTRNNLLLVKIFKHTDEIMADRSADDLHIGMISDLMKGNSTGNLRALLSGTSSTQPNATYVDATDQIISATIRNLSRLDAAFPGCTLGRIFRKVLYISGTISDIGNPKEPVKVSPSGICNRWRRNMTTLSCTSGLLSAVSLLRAEPIFADLLWRMDFKYSCEPLDKLSIDIVLAPPEKADILRGSKGSRVKKVQKKTCTLVHVSNVSLVQCMSHIAVYICGRQDDIKNAVRQLMRRPRLVQLVK